MAKTFAGAMMLVAGACAASAVAKPPHHVIALPDQIQWKPGPPSLPAGAQSAILYGDPAKEGMFVMRLKLPKNYRIPPHTHPRPEIVTVISGVLKVGMDASGDPRRARALPAGGLFAFDPGMTHYVSADRETIIQLSSTGPWTISYVRPVDDPRTKKK